MFVKYFTVDMISPKKSINKISWPHLVIEAFLVVLSVLLALGLNSWRESRSNEQLAVRALKSVTDEFSENCSRISTFHQYHKDVALGNREPEGLQIGLIQNSAWEAARSTGATAYIDYEIASVIEKTFVAQGDHRTLFQSYIQALLTKVGAAESIEQVHGSLDVVTIRELVRIQETLLNDYATLENLLTNNNDISLENFCQIQ